MNVTDFYEPIFPQAEAVKLLTPRFATIDNWLRYEHFTPSRDENGRRVFSFSDLLAIEATDMLAALFKMPPSVAAGMGKRASEGYAPHFDSEAASVARGGIETRRLDTHFTFRREGEEVHELADGETADDSVMLVLPTGTLARQLLKRVAAA